MKQTLLFENLNTILGDVYGLASRFNFFKANFVLRRCNIVVDRLAGLTNVWDN